MAAVSIIIPVYNAEAYLERCIDSILSQSCPDIEVLLIDDGSTDSSFEICQRFAERDERVRIHRQENGGEGSARNTGMELARGKYLMFADNDDVLPPDAVSILLDAMERTDADLAVGEYTRVIGPHRIRKRLLPEYDFLSMQEYMTAHARSPRPTDFFFLCVWNKMYRAEIIKKYGITMAPRSFLNDYAFVLDYLARTKTVAIAHEPVYDYIFRSSSVLQTALLEMDQKVDWEKYVWILAYFDRFAKKNLAPEIYERCKRSLSRELGDGGTPFVSVILPAMDGEAALKERLKDILNQTYLNFELILLDDGKQKDIQALLRPLMDRDKRIRCLLLPEEDRQGLYNAALDEVRGKYVMFAGGKSRLRPDMLEKGVEAVRHANPSAAFRGEDLDSPMENRLFRMRTIKAGEIYFTENDPLQDASFLRQYLSGEERTGTSPIM